MQIPDSSCHTFRSDWNQQARRTPINTPPQRFWACWEATAFQQRRVSLQEKQSNITIWNVNHVLTRMAKWQDHIPGWQALFPQDICFVDLYHVCCVAMYKIQSCGLWSLLRSKKWLLFAYEYLNKNVHTIQNSQRISDLHACISEVRAWE